MNERKLKPVTPALPTFFVLDADERVFLAFEDAEWLGRTPPMEFVQRLYLEAKLEEFAIFELTWSVQQELETRVTRVLREMAQTGALKKYGFLGQQGEPRPAAPLPRKRGTLLN